MKYLALLFALLFINLHLFSQDSKLEIPKDWHHYDPVEKKIIGVATEKAYRLIDSLEIRPKKVVVAIIDGDLDVSHEDIENQIWQNPTPSKEGYVNDINGWNFLGTSDGQTITKVGLEAFREYKRLKSSHEGKSEEDFKTKRAKKKFDYFQKVKKDAKINSYITFSAYAKLNWEAFRITDSLVQADLELLEDSVKVRDVLALEVKDSVLNDYYQAAMRSLWRYNEDEQWGNIMEHQKGEHELVMQRIESLDDPSNPRDSIQDNQNSLRDKYYGNPVLYDSTSFHGTFVAALIGASRHNGIGLDGISNEVEIMGIRAVPDGDEFDKDIALAIRYAVDNGAKIINMSFGKYYSPKSKWVEKAMKYAMRKNVLLVQAAGNDKRDIDTVRVYPSLPKRKNARKNSLVIVGASTPEGEIAKFSNFGQEQVDLFAPGFHIYSAVLDNEYMVANGTSFSAPIVSGIAALVWNYFPHLTAKELKEILIQSAEVNKQDGLKGLARSEGVVNAYDAIKIANERYGK